MPSVASRVLSAYRRTGADAPWTDPGASHGVGMEGYYWRIADPASGRAVVALCGTCRTGERDWSVVALASHPGGGLSQGVVEHHVTDPARFGVRAGEVLRGSTERLRVDLAPRARLDITLSPRVAGPARALGPAHLVPWLPQYWQPVAMACDVRGEAVIGEETIRLDGATAYLEKNWGRGFAGDWWWGQASLGEEVGVAFAGGPVGVGPLRAPVCAVALRMRDEVTSLATPLARVRARASDSEWSVRAQQPGLAVTIEGEADPASAHVLPVPDVRTGSVEPRSRQHLAGRLRLEVRRGRRVAYRGETPLAGLERGRAAGG